MAESCTGGLMAARLTERAGSSAYVLGGVVVYSNEAKVALAGVAGGADRARRRGLAGGGGRAGRRALAARFGADVGIGITGIAGPGGGTPGEAGRHGLRVRGAAPTAARLDRTLQLPGRPGDDPRPHDDRRSCTCCGGCSAASDGGCRLARRRARLVPPVRPRVVRRARLASSAAPTSSRRATSASSSRSSCRRAARDALVAFRDAAADPAIWRPVAAEALHLTLAFLGRRPADDVGAVADGPALRGGGPRRASRSAARCCSRRAAPACSCAVARRPRRRARAPSRRASATGLDGRRRLRRPRSARSAPHVTVARLRRGARAAALDRRRARSRSSSRRGAHAVPSRLHPHGARYEPLVRVALR